MKPSQVVILSATMCLITAFAIFVFYSRTEDASHAAAQNTQKEQAPGSKLNRSVAKDSNQSSSAAIPKLKTLTSALSSLDPPTRPVHELLDAYKKKSPASEQDDLEIFSALSYCANKSSISPILRDAVARGESSEAVEALKKGVDDQSELCNRLSRSDFAVRATIARKRADNGDVDAMLNFRHIGPDGKWPGVGETRLPAEQMKAWENDVMQYLQNAANKGSPNALLALSDTYIGPGGIPCVLDATSAESAVQDSAFAAQKNPVMSLAYVYAYQSVANLSDSGKAMFASTIPRYESCLSLDDRQKAKELAHQIVKQCCQRS